MLTRGRAEALERALRDRSGLDDELERLVRVVDEVRAVPLARLQPSPGFRADLRSRLLEEAEQLRAAREAVPAPRRPDPVGDRRPDRRRRLVAGLVAATLVGGTGAAVASSSALPGEALYPLKRGVEQVRLGLAAGDAARGATHLDLARTRLDETELLVLRREDATDVRRSLEALDAFTTHSTTGTDLLLAAYRDSQDPSHLEEVSGFLREVAPRLERIRQQAPPDVRAAIDEAMARLGERQEDLQEALASCGPECGHLVAALPGALLTGTDAAGPVVDPPGVSPSALPSAAPDAAVTTAPEGIGSDDLLDAGAPAPQLPRSVGVDAGDVGAEVGAGGATAQLPGAGVQLPAPGVSTSSVSVPLPSATVGDVEVEPGEVEIDPGNEDCALGLICLP